MHTMTEIERTAADVEKEGMFIGRYVINPLNGKKVPLWIANYVLVEYGTGAIMAVPAHDERDRDFAEKYNLDIIDVITEDNKMINSEEFNGLDASEGFEGIIDKLEKEGRGKRTINYRLRDWLVSRQRYWGCPIPVVYCDECGIVPVKRKIYQFFYQQMLNLLERENLHLRLQSNLCQQLVLTVENQLEGKLILWIHSLILLGIS